MPLISTRGAASVRALGMFSSGPLVVTIQRQASGGGGGGLEVGSTAGPGGGGAGQFKTDTVVMVSGNSKTVAIGAPGGGVPNGAGANGGDLTVSGLAACTGGGGGGPNGGAGRAGGNGGGGGGNGGIGPINPGGVGLDHNGQDGSSGPGGRGGGSASSGATGGLGTVSSISGSPVTYGSGGPNAFVAPPGIGDGGGGAINPGDPPGTDEPGAPGGMGNCVFSYAGPVRATGGTITSAAGKTVHTFSASGTFTVL